jgi:hypothetical protein
MALFTRLIIRVFQLVFLAGTMFFSHSKSANIVFQPAYQPSRTGPLPTINYHLNTGIFENDRKRAKSFSLSFPIIFTVIVFIFLLPLPFSFRSKNQKKKKNSKTIIKSRRLSFSFSSLAGRASCSVAEVCTGTKAQTWVKPVSDSIQWVKVD